jgi:DNA-binding winged helix-turn-helix (wHTH) protein
MSSLPAQGPYRFGDFTFDPGSGELAGMGSDTRLPPRVAAVLALLVERSGAVVSRVELQQRLWPDTTVEFDDGLNSCIRQLRAALGDDANAPRYVETLPKRGYRFLPAVSVVGEQMATGPRGGNSRRWRRGWIGGIVSVGVVVAVSAALLAGDTTLGRTRVKAAVAILPFRVDSTDPRMLQYQQRLVRQLMIDARADQGVRLVDDTMAATHVVSGSLTRQGDSVRVFAQLVIAHSRRHLWADDMLDTYPWAGNSTLMGDRIEKSVSRVLTSDSR